MKCVFSLLLGFFLLSSQESKSCPTCIGTLESDIPEFFSDEFYQPYMGLIEYEDDEGIINEDNEFLDDNLD